MWNWNLGKTLLLGLATSLVLFLAGLSPRGVLVISVAFAVFVHWLIHEINLIRNAHGSNLEEVENNLEDIKSKGNKK